MDSTIKNLPGKTHSASWWERLAQKARKWAPVDSTPVPDHQAHFVSRDGVPDLCCELHRWFTKD